MSQSLGFRQDQVMEPKPKRRIRDLKVNLISLVKRGANFQDAVLIKSDGAFHFDPICKFDGTDKILGLVYVPELVDADGELASADVIRKAAHDALARGVRVDRDHSFDALGDKAPVVESFIVQKGDPRFAGWVDRVGRTIDSEGSWGVVIQLKDEELLKAARSGEIQALSMAGVAAFEPVSKSEPENHMTPEQLKAIQDAVTAAIPTIVGEVTKAMKPAAAPVIEPQPTPIVAPVAPPVDPFSTVGEVQKMRLAEFNARKAALNQDVIEAYGESTPEAYAALAKGLEELQAEFSPKAPVPAARRGGAPAGPSSSNVRKGQVDPSGGLFLGGEHGMCDIPLDTPELVEDHRRGVAIAKSMGLSWAPVKQTA